MSGKHVTKRDWAQRAACKWNKKSNKTCLFLHVFFLVRRGGSVPSHQACGAGHQGHGGELREASAAVEGHQPRVEQPHGLHVIGQARCKILLRNINLPEHRIVIKHTFSYACSCFHCCCRHPDMFCRLKCRYTQTPMLIEQWRSIHNKKPANNIMKC